MTEPTDPRILALAKARQQIGHKAYGSTAHWSSLQADEERLFLEEADAWLRAAIAAGIAPAAEQLPTAKPRWASRLRWDSTDTTTHDGRKYQLETHSYPLGNGNWSGTDDYHVHEFTGPSVCRHPRYGPLGTSRRHAVRLAELRILGWTPAQAMDREPETGRDRWRSPDGELHALDDVLSGAVPH